MPLQVALMGSWHGFPNFSYIQFLQQALFRSLPTKQERQQANTWCAFYAWIKQKNRRSFISVPSQVWFHSHMRELYLHCFLGFSLQSKVQQGSVWRYTSPGSQSSPSSTREFPHTLLFLSLKHDGPLSLSLFTMDILLQLENSCEQTQLSHKSK